MTRSTIVTTGYVRNNGVKPRLVVKNRDRRNSVNPGNCREGLHMMNRTTRRDVLKSGVAVAGLGLLGVPEWVLPALAQGETDVPFTDIPDNVRWETPPDRRGLDV